MSDTAKGPLTGYLFQFEKALLLLTSLEKNNDFISIENVDDIAKHKEDGTVLLTVQAKHSISNSGTTFEDTSYALWRTFQIWIQKLEKKVLNENTEFICSTNKIIPKESLLQKINNNDFKIVIEDFQTLLNSQKEKINKLNKKDLNKGNNIKQTISLIEFVLENQHHFKTIKKNIKIEDNENIKDKFFSKLFLGSVNYTETKKESIYQEFFGWITTNSKARWKNGTEAIFTKKNFDDKHFQIFQNSSIMNAVFRTKESLGSIEESEIQKKRKDLFVKQIEDINRRKTAKERIIKEAILDYIYSDIELSYIITKGDYTESDFEEFLKQCHETWQTSFDEKIIKEIEEYTDEEKNSLAIDIYDRIMNNIEIKFKAGFGFNSTNKYIRNGSFLKLSNIPKIGWRPDWEIKYKNKDEV